MHELQFYPLLAVKSSQCMYCSPDFMVYAELWLIIDHSWSVQCADAWGEKSYCDFIKWSQLQLDNHGKYVSDYFNINRQKMSYCYHINYCLNPLQNRINFNNINFICIDVHTSASELHNIVWFCGERAQNLHNTTILLLM